MEAPGFWDDVEGSQKKMKELKSLKDDVAVYAGLEEKFEDIETLIEMGEEENDPDLVPEVEEAMTEFEEAFEKIRIKTLLSERYDKNNAIVSLHAGAGGTESCDWCQMLYRMYTRWAADKEFSVEVLDSLDGDEAGIKSITFQVPALAREGLCIVKIRTRCAPSGAYFPVQCGRKKTDFVRVL